MSDLTVPPLPMVDGGLVEEHTERRGAVAARLGSLDDAPGRSFRWYGRIRLIETLANLFVDDRELLFAPRRRHLRQSHEARLGGASAVFEYIDVRLEMWRRGHLDRAVGLETPHVINAFAESHDRSPTVTNPGLVRLTSSGFDTTQSRFMPPDGAHCAELLDQCVTIANTAPMKPVMRAAWLCASVLAIHPFVDGNGRTARSLFQLVSSSDDAQFDWATIEQWAIDRNSYVEALKASQAGSIPDYVGERIDTSPFVEYAVRSSLKGLDLVDRRIEWFEAAWDRLGGRTDSERIVEVAVVTAGSSSIDELARLVEDPECSEVVSRLVRERRLDWDRRGLLGPGPSSVLPDLGV